MGSVPPGMRAGLVLLVLCGLLATSGAASTYYVGGTGATDSGPGSSDEPWATLQYAVDLVAPGDTILVRPGTYVGFHIGYSGTAGASCTIAAETPGTVLVNSAGAYCYHNSNIEAEDVSYWIIDGLESANSAHYGIDIRGSDHMTVRNCHAHGAASTGIMTAFSDYAVLENNDTHNNGEHGIYNANSSDYVTLRGNQSYSNFGCGIHNNGDISMGGDGQISYATIERNTIWDNGAPPGGGSAINCDGVSDSIIRNNLLYGNHASGISLYGGDSAEGSSRDQVYNNTIVMAADGRYNINISGAIGGQPVNSTGISVVNNILYNNHSWHGVIFAWDASALTTSDYNVVMDRFAVTTDEVIISFADWQALGFDAHSFIATPEELFVDTAGNDYHLAAGSPAVDAGRALAPVTDDIEGTPRPRGAAYDIGCYESAYGGHFWDVPPSRWAYAEIEVCANAGIVGGFPDGSYQPLLVVNRDAMAGFISRCLAMPGVVPDGPPTPHFPDVPTDQWAYKYIEFAYANNIVAGYPGGNYEPDLPVDRGQMAAFVARAIVNPTGEAGLAGYDPPATPSFPDVDTGFWTYKHIEYIHGLGIAGGYPDGLYHPEIQCTRDQMAVYVARAFELPL